MPLPAPPVSLEEKQEVTRLLLASGANIHEINAVRKHISGIKGRATGPPGRARHGGIAAALRRDRRFPRCDRLRPHRARRFHLHHGFRRSVQVQPDGQRSAIRVRPHQLRHAGRGCGNAQARRPDFPARAQFRGGQQPPGPDGGRPARAGTGIPHAYPGQRSGGRNPRNRPHARGYRSRNRACGPARQAPRLHYHRRGNHGGAPRPGAGGQKPGIRAGRRHRYRRPAGCPGLLRRHGRHRRPHGRRGGLRRWRNARTASPMPGATWTTTIPTTTSGN